MPAGGVSQHCCARYTLVVHAVANVLLQMPSLLDRQSVGDVYGSSAAGLCLLLSRMSAAFYCLTTSALLSQETSDADIATLLLYTLSCLFTPTPCSMLKALLLSRSHHACNHQRCNVCINSPKKQCRSNFAEKYIMKEALVARCKQEITVSIVAASGHQASQDLACRCHLQACTLIAGPID